ncbi:MAG: hypothetical protein K6F69_01185 [Treponema sp.]|nr:hypothetical protein [Treponema sp.]
MIELVVNPRNVAAISGALKKITDMVKTGAVSKDDTIHIVLEQGIYEEILSYNLSNPLIMEGKAGTKAEDCVVKAENCEAFHKDTENRAVFVIGMNATKVTLRNFTIINTHEKTLPDANLGNQAEALCFHNYKGTLFAEGMRFSSHQDTIHVKGFSYFKDCYVEGDIDYIWGYCDLSLFDHCIIHTLQDNRGDDLVSYVLQSRAINGKKGFVFKDCSFTGVPRKTAGMYIGRSAGTGKYDSVDRWDSIALINCTVDECYSPEFYTDEDGTRKVYPSGKALVGWREYGTKTRKTDGTVEISDTSKRYYMNYVMTDKEYKDNYSSLDLILAGTPLSSQKSKN